MADKPTRDKAWTILTDHVKSPSLLSHALAVEAVMRHVARKRSADEDLWGVRGTAQVAAVSIGDAGPVDVYETVPFHLTTSAPSRLLRVCSSVLKSGCAPRIGMRLMTHWNTQSSMLMTASVTQISIQDG